MEIIYKTPQRSLEKLAVIADKVISGTYFAVTDVNGVRRTFGRAIDKLTPQEQANVMAGKAAMFFEQSNKYAVLDEKGFPVFSTFQYLTIEEYEKFWKIYQEKLASKKVV